MSVSTLRFFGTVHQANRYRQTHPARWLRDVSRYWRNRVLAPVEFVLERIYAPSDHPIVFIVGGPRTGSTVLHQVMVEYLDVGYVTNDMAPYWSAPLTGTVLHGRCGGRHGIALRSDYGRADGSLSPHEFSWFWHDRIDFRDHDDLTDEELERVDAPALRRTFEAMAGYYGRPLLLKTPKFTAFQIRWLKRVLPSARFVWIRRDREANIQSILRARVAEQGDASKWWAARPRDYLDYLDRPPREQVEHQVDSIARAVSEALAELPADAHLDVHYETLVEAPEATLRKLAAFVGTGVADEAALDRLVLEPSR